MLPRQSNSTQICLLLGYQGFLWPIPKSNSSTIGSGHMCANEKGSELRHIGMD